MSGTITISVDVMGGDLAPRAPLHGAKLLLRERPDVGSSSWPREAVEPLMAEFPSFVPFPKSAIRKMWSPWTKSPARRCARARVLLDVAAIQSVKDGEAQVAISVATPAR